MAQQKVVELVFGKNVSVALSALAKADIAEHLKDGPINIDILARKAGVNADALNRMLRLVATKDVFKEVEHGVFANTPQSECLASSNLQGCRDMVIHMNSPSMSRTYTNIGHCLRTGESPFAASNGGRNLFEYHNTDEGREDGGYYNRAMANAGTKGTVADGYDFSSAGIVVDVGGGYGRQIKAILAKFPTVAEGVVFDLSHVVSGIDMSNEDPRFKAVAGDMFASINSSADVILLVNVIHDWPNDKGVEILKSCAKALKTGGKILIVEKIMSGELNASFIDRMFDFVMMMSTPN